MEQNIYIAYKFNGLIKQTTIDINLMINYDLVNKASEQISNILNVQNKGKVKNLDQLKNFYNIDYRAPFSVKSLKEMETNLIFVYLRPRLNTLNLMKLGHIYLT